MPPKRTKYRKASAPSHSILRTTKDLVETSLEYRNHMRLVVSGSAYYVQQNSQYPELQTVQQLQQQDQHAQLSSDKLKPIILNPWTYHSWKCCSCPLVYSGPFMLVLSAIVPASSQCFNGAKLRRCIGQAPSSFKAAM